MLMQIFLPCFFVEEVSRASETLPSALLHLNWPDGDKTARLTTTVLGKNLRTALKMKILGLLEIDVENFVKFAYSRTRSTLFCRRSSERKFYFFILPRK